MMDNWCVVNQFIDIGRYVASVWSFLSVAQLSLFLSPFKSWACCNCKRREVERKERTADSIQCDRRNVKHILPNRPKQKMRKQTAWIKKQSTRQSARTVHIKIWKQTHRQKPITFPLGQNNSRIIYTQTDMTMVLLACSEPERQKNVLKKDFHSSKTDI